jgi:hypothetical protein
MASTGDFSFPDFNAFSESSTFNHTPGLPPSIQTSQPLYPTSSSAGSPTAPPQSAGAGSKRKADSVSSPGDAGSFEDASRLAAEEDKRRRNTFPCQEEAKRASPGALSEGDVRQGRCTGRTDQSIGDREQVVEESDHREEREQRGHRGAVEEV